MLNKNVAILASLAGSLVLGACSSDTNPGVIDAGANNGTNTAPVNNGTVNPLSGFTGTTPSVTPAPVVDPNERIAPQLADGV